MAQSTPDRYGEPTDEELRAVENALDYLTDADSEFAADDARDVSWGDPLADWHTDTRARDWDDVPPECWE